MSYPPGYGTTVPSTSAVGDAAAAGTSAVGARIDHLHGREAFNATPSTQAFGDAAAAGASATVERGGHKHAMPTTPAATAFSAGADQTASRAMDGTVYTNGTRRRWVVLTARCISTVTDKAYFSYSTVAGGTTLAVTDVCGQNAGLSQSSNYSLTFPVDPGASYSVSTDKGAGATVSLIKWMEIDG